MKPTWVHHFYADLWPTRIWITIITLFVAAPTTLACAPSPDVLRDLRSILWLLAVGAISLALGFFVSVASYHLFPVLSFLYWVQSQRNGAPLQVGDTVQILARRHRGRVTQVYTRWQGETLRVDLGEETKQACADVFHPIELLKQACAGASSLGTEAARVDES